MGNRAFPGLDEGSSACFTIALPEETVLKGVHEELGGGAGGCAGDSTGSLGVGDGGRCDAVGGVHGTGGATGGGQGTGGVVRVVYDGSGCDAGRAFRVKEIRWLVVSA